MKIITERKLREFWQPAKGAEMSRRENAVREWIKVVRAADWQSFSNLKNTFNSADVYKNCTIFDVGGNKYRIIAKIEYRKHLVFNRFVLSHSEYDHKKWQLDCR